MTISTILHTKFKKNSFSNEISRGENISYLIWLLVGCSCSNCWPGATTVPSPPPPAPSCTVGWWPRLTALVALTPAVLVVEIGAGVIGVMYSDWDPPSDVIYKVLVFIIARKFRINSRNQGEIDEIFTRADIILGLFRHLPHRVYSYP